LEPIMKVPPGIQTMSFPGARRGLLARVGAVASETSVLILSPIDRSSDNF